MDGMQVPLDPRRQDNLQSIADMKMEELFISWISLESTEKLLQDALRLHRSPPTPVPRTLPDPLTSSLNVPPRSPPSSKNIKFPTVGETPPSPAHTSIRWSPAAGKEKVPRFYQRKVGQTSSSAQQEIASAFEEFPEGIAMDEFVAITKDLCGFPSFFNAPLFRRIVEQYHPQRDTLDFSKATGETPLTLTREVFVQFWNEEMEAYDAVERFFRLVKQPDAEHMTKHDLFPYLKELLTYHPGLDFLAGTPEFQEKYALTVIVRIFYAVDRHHRGALSLRDIRRSDVVEAFTTVDEEEDINQVFQYFSYEHFYVLYCKFWELDTDHDFEITRDDLMRYDGHALTRVVVDRIFEFGYRPFGRMQTRVDRSRMNYEDFIYFMLSEEDKSNAVSLRYWFALVDVNEDGVIHYDEMKFFYSHQLRRMEALGHEVVPFADICCQLCDLINPESENEYYLSDLTSPPEKMRTSGVFFNVLFNLQKFMMFEQRDPFVMRQQLAEPSLTEWDRYARQEYARLAMEEDLNQELELDENEDAYYAPSHEDPDPERHDQSMEIDESASEELQFDKEASRTRATIAEAPF